MKMSNSDISNSQKIYFIDGQYYNIDSSASDFNCLVYDKNLDILEVRRDVDDTKFPRENRISSDEFNQLQEMIDGEPLVTVVYSESEYLRDGETYSLSKADKIFEIIDRKTHEKYGKEGRYDKTKFEIKYVRDGRIHTYAGRQDMGDLDGSLVEHIHNAAMEDMNENARYEEITNDLVPYLKLHISLSIMEQIANDIYAEVKHSFDTNSIEGDILIKSANELHEMTMYVAESHVELNTSKIPEIEEPPELHTLDQLILEDYKEKVRKEVMQEAEKYDMTLQEYADNGYMPRVDDRQRDNIDAEENSLNRKRKSKSR